MVTICPICHTVNRCAACNGYICDACGEVLPQEDESVEGVTECQLTTE
jgi:hypothetical protein